MDAVAEANTDLLEELLKSVENQGLDFHIGFQSPLTRAAIKGECDIVEKLLLAGASVDFLHRNGYTPLMEAVDCGNLDVCHLLLSHGADVHKARNIYNAKNTALHYAARAGELEVVALLVEHGACICDHSLISLKPFAALRISPAGFALRQNRSQVLNSFLDYCKADGQPLPLEPLFQMAIMENSDQCAIVVLKQGYFPMHKVYSNYGTHFERVAKWGRISLMGVLMGMNTQFMQEDWLIQKELPHTLEQHTGFVSWLLECRKQTPSLQALCKSRILSQLGTYYMPKIDALPLPKTLRTYLAVVESSFIPNNRQRRRRNKIKKSNRGSWKTWYLVRPKGN